MTKNKAQRNFNTSSSFYFMCVSTLQQSLFASTKLSLHLSVFLSIHVFASLAVSCLLLVRPCLVAGSKNHFRDR